MPALRQPSFAGGEWAPGLWGRNDIGKYAVAMRYMRNAYATGEGAFVNRPGSRLSAMTRGGVKARSVAFVASSSDTLLLVFTDAAVTVYGLDPAAGMMGPLVASDAPPWTVGPPYKAGDLVTNFGQAYAALHDVASGAGSPLTNPADWDGTIDQASPLVIPSPYLEADLPRLRTRQVGDVVTIVHPDHPPRELRREAAYRWRLALISEAPTVPSVGGLDLISPLQVAPDVAHPAKEWAWRVTAINADGDESLPTAMTRPAASATAAQNRKIVLYTDYPVTLEWAPVEGAVAYNVYRGRAGVFGWVGQAQEIGTKVALAVQFRDDGDKPNYAKRPPRGKPVFVTPAWTAGTMYEQGDRVVNGARLYECIRAGTSGPAGGPTGTGTNIVDGTTIFWTINTVYAPGSRVVSNGDTLRTTLGGTSAAAQPGPSVVNPAWDAGDNGIAWAFVGHGGAVLWKYVQEAPARKRYPRCVGFYEGRRVFGGSEEFPELVRFSRVDGYSGFEEYPDQPPDGATSLLLASNLLQEVRGLVGRDVLFAFTSSGEWALRGAGDGEIIAPGRVAAHEGSRYGSDWTEPCPADEAVFFVREKGSLPMAMVPAQGGGWTAEDVTLFARHLFRGRKVVRFAFQSLPHPILWVVFDDGLVGSLSWVRSQEIAAWALHDLSGGAPADGAEDVEVVPEGAEDGVYLTMRRGGTRYIERIATRTVSDAAEGIFLDSALTYRGPPATHFSGLGHLEGRTVVALADGLVIRTGLGGAPLVVTGGAIDLEEAASLVHVGLPYRAYGEILDAAEGRKRAKSVSEVTLEYEDTRGALVGESLAGPLREIVERTAADGTGAPPLQTGQRSVRIEGGWNTGGRAVIVQDDPLPMTILAVTREVIYGG